MKSGSYWINDKTRYGWEVIRVYGDYYYKFGIDNAFMVSDLLSNGTEVFPIEPPESI